MQVERECSDYDSAMLKAVAVFCKTKGVEVDEATLRQQLGNIRIQRLKEDGQDNEVCELDLPWFLFVLRSALWRKLR